MNASKWFVPAMTIIILVAVLVGFIYLQREINGFKNSNTSTSTSSSTSGGSSSPQSNSTASVTITNTTTATYEGTTLVCTWGSGNDGFLFISNGSSSIISINYLNITNIGTSTAYVSNLRIQAYYSNCTQAYDVMILLDASGAYSSMPTPKPVPFTVSPGESLVGNPFSARAIEAHVNQVGTLDNNIFASYTITPVWSSTP